MSSSGVSSQDDAQTTAALPAPDCWLETQRTGPGSTLGRYAIVGVAGIGAMGEVYRAYDPKLQREVALKRVRGDRFDDESRMRTVREARAMAMLSHPNVVAVYDVEESPDGPHRGLILVMEFVGGQTLRAWMRDLERPWSEVVNMFVRAGRGLAAAHAKELLHRDFKPSNVVVSSNGEPKVMDFGLAKATDTEVSRRSVSGWSQDSIDPDSDAATEAGTVMGTPRYMAPEQHRGVNLDPAADQYAFCVALWEALSGKPPFTGKDLETQKRRGPPRWQQSRVPTRIGSALRRGLAANPSERWPHMNALLDALDHRPGASRRKLGLAAVGGLALAGAGVGTGSWLDTVAKRCTGAEAEFVGIWDDARREVIEQAIVGTQVNYAPHVWSQVAKNIDAHVDAWVQMHTETCEATTVYGEQSTQVMDLRMGCLQQAKLQVEALTNVLATSDAGVVQNAVQATTGLPSLSRCADIAGLQADVQPPSPEDLDGVTAIRRELAAAQNWQYAGHLAEAEAAQDRAETLLMEVDYPPIRPQVTLNRAVLHLKRADPSAGEALLRQTLQDAVQQRRWPLVRTAATELIAVVGLLQNRPEVGLRYRELADGLADGEPRAESLLRINVGLILWRQGKFKEAEQEHRQALAIAQSGAAPDPVRVAAAFDQIATDLYSQREFQEAEAEHRHALAVRMETLGSEHPEVARTRHSLAKSIMMQGRHAEAEAEFRKILALWLETYGPDHPAVSAAHHTLASVLGAQGKLAEAEIEAGKAVAIFERRSESDSLNLATVLLTLARAVQEQGRHAEAESQYRRVLKIREEKLGPDHPDVAGTLRDVASSLAAQGKHVEAESLLRRALALWQETQGEGYPGLANVHAELALALLAQGKPQQAVVEGELGWRGQQAGKISPEDQAQLAFVLARALVADADGRASSRAFDLAREAEGNYLSAGPAFADDHQEVQRWLQSRDSESQAP